MPTYILSYDLKAPRKNYDTLTTYLKSLGTWWHNLGSTWVVATDQTATQLRDGIKQHTDTNDRVLVVQSAGIGAWSGIPDQGSAWLKEHL